MQVRLTGKGHPRTSTADFHYEYDGFVLYEYDGFVLPQWETGVDQRLVIRWDGAPSEGPRKWFQPGQGRFHGELSRGAAGCLTLRAPHTVFAEMVDAIGTHESAEVGISGIY